MIMNSRCTFGTAFLRQDLVVKPGNPSTQKAEEGTIIVSSSLSRPTQEDPASKQRNTLWYIALPERLEVTHHWLPRPFPGELLGFVQPNRDKGDRWSGEEAMVV